MKKLVFILSSSHAGSTMLDLILGTHDDCSSLGEAWRKKGDGCDLCGSVCKHWNGFNYKKDVKFYKRLFDRFDSPILIDSSKKEDWTRTIAQNMSNVKVIRLKRDGRRRLLTYKKKFGEVSPEQIKRWVRKEKKIKWATRDIKCLDVKYEEICDGNGLQECCDYIGIKYHPKIREYWKGEHHGFYGSCRAFSLVKSFNDIGMNNEECEFVEKQGLKVKADTDFSFLNGKELTYFEKYGSHMNRKLGYII